MRGRDEVERKGGSKGNESKNIFLQSNYFISWMVEIHGLCFKWEGGLRKDGLMRKQSLIKKKRPILGAKV